MFHCWHFLAHALEALLDIGRPAISYGCEVWGSQCHDNLTRLVSDAKKLQGVQLAFLRNVCGRLPVGLPAAAIFAELAADPCSLKWWGQLVRFALRISDLPQVSPHCEILTDNVQDALAKPSSANWAAKKACPVIGPASAFCS